MNTIRKATMIPFINGAGHFNVTLILNDGSSVSWQTWSIDGNPNCVVKDIMFRLAVHQAEDAPRKVAFIFVHNGEVTVMYDAGNTLDMLNLTDYHQG